MRRMMKSAILAGAALFAAPLAPEASASHLKLGGLRVGIGCGGVQITLGRRAPTCHSHSWSYSYRRVWEPPVYRQVIAEFDHCGRPIYRRVMVRCGYWRYVRVRSCCCGLSQDC